jgi:integrase
LGISMPRRLKDSALDTRNARLKLPVRREPYWRGVGPGLHIGYRRLPGVAGSWIKRSYDGSKYSFDAFAKADDHQDSDGETVLTFWQAIERMRGGKTAGGARPSFSVADAMAHYLQMLEGEHRSAHSLADTKARIDSLILPALGNIMVDDLTTDQLRKWRDGLAKVGPRRRGKSTGKNFPVDDDAKRKRRANANRVWTVLRAGLNLAFHDGKADSNQAWARVKPFKSVDVARIRYLSVAECNRLVNACPADFRLLVRAALATGCRYGELIRLTVADFNPDSGTIGIRISKSGRSRHVVLTDEGRAFFAEITAGRGGDAIMLQRADGEPWGKSHVARPMAAAVAAAKITPAVSFHTLRHSWASLATMAGIPLMIVAKNLGHTDTRMCEKHYSHLAPSFVADAIRKSGPVFGFKPDRKVTPLR